MQPLVIRPTGRQLAGVWLFAGALVVAALVILVGRYVADASWPGNVAEYGFAAAVTAPFVAWVGVRYARSFTVCDASGIRSRGLGREWRCDWQFVAGISIRTGIRNSSLRTVVVQTTAGDRLQLGIPVTGGVMPDNDFDARVSQIRAYWQSAVGADNRVYAVPGVPVLIGVAEPVPVRTLVRIAVAVVLLAAVITLLATVWSTGPALLVRLGEGQRGSYTATTSICQETCFWLGDFQPAHGSASRIGMAMAPGARIVRAGQQVAAVYPGSGGLVYPAGGGTAWTSLAVVLLIIIGCLPLVVIWTVQWRRSSRLQPAIRVYRPDAGLPRTQWRRGHSVTAVRGGILIAVEIVALIAAGVVVASQASLVPRAPSSSAVACASYQAWVLAQPESGPPARDPALLTDAVLAEPPGQLGIDLATLQSDVGSAIAAPPGELALGARAIVLTDMSHVTHDCSG